MGHLRKSKDNAVIFGVLGGLGEYFNIDPVLLRVIVVVATFVGVGATVPIYLILALILPEGSSSKRNPRRTSSDRSSSFSNRGPQPKQQRKEAEKVDEDDWSDF
ncbi:PspC domain-containing protein [Marinilactibacillus piezotolerans]|uniref:PspC domain-containing protein n=1 Tax=Marinilactibacillus piezotolerans TaxID=258723 RepID=UPI0009AF5F15|nr:PspC domain-containing protein [Marinilactibacillus piezotolerans]